MSEQFNKLYTTGDLRNVDKIFNEYRCVNLTIEALEDDCSGKLTCRSDLLLKHRNKSEP